MGLTSHGNVFQTCLRILRSKGYELEIDGEIEPDGSYPVNKYWIARRNDFYFCADNPIELLGLISVYDHVKPAEDKPYWWKVDGPDIESELLEAAFPDPNPGI